MRSFAVMSCVLTVLLVAGCSSDTSTNGNGEAEYPDITGLVVFYNFDGDLENSVSNLECLP